MIQNLIVVIRSAGERTLDLCKSLVLQQVQQDRVWVVDERPFESALRRSYQIGMQERSKWLMTIDADVLLREGAVVNLFKEAENLQSQYFQIEGLVYDKLTGMRRKAGHRMYRTKYLETALQQIPETYKEVRPEYTTLQKMEAMGFPSMEIRTVIGIHDFEQYYRDIYRKAYVYANKHQVWLPELITRCKKHAYTDKDYQIALRGLYDGLMTCNRVKIDTRAYDEVADGAMTELGITEKPQLTLNKIGSNQIESIIAASGRFPESTSAKPLAVKIQRLKHRYKRLGMLRVGPYLFGSLLCDIGAAIKRATDKRR